jgi:hydroxymethylpyrimidine/phosphomethylpyrimidine kinase
MSALQVSRVLSIGGSDSGGSAGIQADLKTFEARDVFGSTALTAVTAQNTQGVRRVYPLPEELIEAQIKAVLDDIGADAIKTGLLGRESVVRLTADLIHTYGIPKVVVDPVMVNGQGQLFVSPETMRAYQTRLFPLATFITPNLDEAALLANMPISAENDLYDAAQRLHQWGSAFVLIKGGHLAGDGQIIDLVYDGRDFMELPAPRLPIHNPHGVGCTFASAIAAALAKGKPPLEAVQTAHGYLQAALQGSLARRIGGGRQPVYHRVEQNPHVKG